MGDMGHLYQLGYMSWFINNQFFAHYPEILCVYPKPTSKYMIEAQVKRSTCLKCYLFRVLF